MRARKLSTWLTSALLGGAAIATAGGASAQSAQASGTTGFALERFLAAPAGDRFFGVSSPYASGDPAVHVALLADYASNPLLISRVKGTTEPTGVVTDQALLHVNATFAIFDRLAVNIDIPAVIDNGGNDPTYRGVTFASPHNASFADLRFGLRARLLGAERDLFQLGVQGFLWAPTGSKADFSGDGEVRGMPQLLLGGLRDRFVWSFTAGAQLRPKTVYNNVVIGNSMEFGAGIGVRIGDERRVQVGPEATVGFSVDQPVRRNTHAEILLGAKYRVIRDVEIGAAAGPGLTPGYGTPDVRFVGSIAYTPDRYPPPAPPPDKDGDGVTDDLDKCPTQPEGDHPDPKRPGCPAPPDRDKDGIADDVDACIDVPGVESSDPAKNGCPGDADGDGVIDAQDKCPDKAQGPKPDPLNPGCPAPPDADGDGVLDRDDACPSVAGPPNQDRAKNGCPVVAAVDSDGDGITDDKDACPELKGPADQDPKKNGCPRTVRLSGNEISILEQVEFKTGTDKLTGNSDTIISEVAGVLKEHPEILKVEVQGHTDDQGKKAINKALSQKRAEAVQKALEAKGVAKERLAAKGYGQEQPIADNKTEEGRQKNRRVQFKILEKKK
jgi:outer membrane protein OmpA-like peptidoglycan-associated protein